MAARAANQSNTLTGYYLKKYVDGTTSLKVGNTSKRNHVWTYFRYGEVLLNYAEAMVEGYGDINYKNPPSLPLSALEAVNIIRKRKEVNMPEYDSGMSATQFKEKLRNERMVELAFEDHRFWDIRRWMIGDQTTDIYGVEITKELTGGIKIEQRCVGSDLPLAGGKAKIPERYQEQMCGCIETLTDAIHNNLFYGQCLLTDATLRYVNHRSQYPKSRNSG